MLSRSFAEDGELKHLSKLLCVAMLITLASCSGSGGTVPVVRDYTKGNPTHNVQPQSVVERCPPYDSSCKAGGGGGGGITKGYNTYVEQACWATNGIYISEEFDPATDGMVYCANSANPVRDDQDPNGCPGDVTATWSVTQPTVTVKPLGGTSRTYNANKGIRIGLDCYMTVDGVPIGFPL